MLQAGSLRIAPAAVVAVAAVLLTAYRTKSVAAAVGVALAAALLLGLTPVG